jgi:hypothetical protein
VIKKGGAPHRHAEEAGLPRATQAQSDSSRLLIVVRVCGAFVAALRDGAEIILADVDRQSAKPSACPFPWALLRSADLAMMVPLHRKDGCTQPFPRRERPRSAGCWACIGGGMARQATASSGQESDPVGCGSIFSGCLRPVRL